MLVFGTDFFKEYIAVIFKMFATFVSGVLGRDFISLG
jgi:hypothetical protein